MLRVSIIKGQTLDGIEGPFVFTADSYLLDGEVRTGGEWLVTASGPQLMAEYMTEETTIATPLIFALVVYYLVSRIRMA